MPDKVYVNTDVDFYKILSGLFFEKRASVPDCNIFIVKNLKNTEKQITKNYPYIQKLLIFNVCASIFLMLFYFTKLGSCCV